ncbi:hypothetical protein ACFVWT_04520 [Arthrobacter sp. NPDC058288]|uniref:hypothetical protein n=1 Tax=Arthrobacter sp. NPDC058288 TaxID=3346424 RepID=UPI0036E686C8
MTAAELNAEAATIAAEITLVQGVTAQQRLRGLTGAFDYHAPLPETVRRSWEPAARRYRELGESEKEA